MKMYRQNNKVLLFTSCKKYTECYNSFINYYPVCRVFLGIPRENGSTFSPNRENFTLRAKKSYQKGAAVLKPAL